MASRTQGTRRDYSDAFKKKLVKRYLAKGGGDAIAKEVGVGAGLIYRWAQDPRFGGNKQSRKGKQPNGSAGIPQVPKPKRKYTTTDAGKGEAVRRLTAGESSEDIGADYGVTGSTIYAWRKKIEAKRKPKSKSKTKRKTFNRSTDQTPLAVRVANLEADVEELRWEMGLD